jgi:ankyrin repeat protein
MTKLEQIADGQTDAVFEFISGGGAPTAADRESVSLVQWCAYYGDVSALKFLLSKGATLESLGDNIGLTAACFHGHWQLCRFLVEQGADVNRPEAETGETPLHNALCKTDRLRYNLVLRVLLALGANPNCATKSGIETGGLCAIAGRKGRRRCTGRRPSATRKRFRCCWMRVPRLTLPTHMEIRRSAGPVGICARSPS